MSFNRPRAASADPESVRRTARCLQEEATTHPQALDWFVLSKATQEPFFSGHNRAYVNLIHMQRRILVKDRDQATTNETYKDAWLSSLGVLGKFTADISHHDAKSLIREGLMWSGVNLYPPQNGTKLDIQSEDKKHAFAIADIIALMASSKMKYDDSGYHPATFEHQLDGPMDALQGYDPEAFITHLRAIVNIADEHRARIERAQADANGVPASFGRDAKFFSDCVASTASWFDAYCSNLVKLRTALYGAGVNPHPSHDDWLGTVEDLRAQFLGGVSHVEAGQKADSIHQMSITDNITGEVIHGTGSFEAPSAGEALAMITIGCGMRAFGQP